MTELQETAIDQTRSGWDAPHLDELRQALQRLDQLLEHAMTVAQAAFGQGAAPDPYRGLYISRQEAERLLAREPGVPVLWTEGNDPEAVLPEVIGEDARLAWLGRAFGLSPFDIDVVVIALAPELDLLCPSIAAKLARREHFAATAPLTRHGLLHLLPDPQQLQLPLLAYYLKLDEQIVRLLLGHEGLDARLALFCQPVQPSVSLDALPLRTEVKQALPALVGQARKGHQPLRITLDDDGLDALASRFRLMRDQIAEATVAASNQPLWRAAAQSPEALASQSCMPLSLRDLLSAGRARSGHDLATLAHKIEPRYTWDDIVLPEDALAQLRKICQRVAHRHRVLGEWGFDRKLSQEGVNALFAGPSGTGKIMAAEIIANELGLHLHKIDLRGVVSKYIGETEKNLDRIFRAAENANAILFFDEADALFGKRSEVRDSHDRYSNIEISYLLQKMEEYDGVAILATNLRQNLDEAFVRRLAFMVHFPFPYEASRQRIWASIWPAAAPLAEDVNLDIPAHQFKLSGGNIKNIALAAAFLVAEDSGLVTVAHLLQAVRREYQKMGKVLSAAELNGDHGHRPVAR